MGKKDTCPFCSEKVALSEIAGTSAWRKQVGARAPAVVSGNRCDSVCSPTVIGMELAAGHGSVSVELASCVSDGATPCVFGSWVDTLARQQRAFVTRVGCA